MVGQNLLTVDAPWIRGTSLPLIAKNLQSIRMTYADNTFIFISVKSFDLPEGVEIFQLDISTSCDLIQYPGGSPFQWYPVAWLNEAVQGSTIENIRVLSASWQVVKDESTRKYYGSDPKYLDYDFSESSASYDLEDGIILFLSNKTALTISAASDLPGTLTLLLSKSQV